MSLTRAAVIALVALALGLGACGRKGALKPPEGEEDSYTYPQTYPASETVLPGPGPAPKAVEDGATESEEITNP